MLAVSKSYPTIDEFLHLSGQKDFNLIPVYRELVADLETPVSVYAKIFPEGNSCLLESVEGGVKLARYSFIAGEPYLTLKSWGEYYEITGDGQKKKIKGSYLDALREILSSYRAAQIPGLPRFSGGAVGYLGYDTARLLENLPPAPDDDLALPDACLLFPETVISFDHYTSRLKVIVNTRIGGSPKAAYQRAEEKLDQITERLKDRGNFLQGGKFTNVTPSTDNTTMHSNISPEQFKAGVESIKEYIRAGDIFQAVLSQRFEAETDVNPFSVYRALRTLNPSPYMFYLDLEEVKLAGASPEIMARLEGGIIETRPIAGTRPRGKTPAQDCELGEELFRDAKERSEHVMLVDLGRNDIGRVSKYGSVEVPVFLSCERYSHVMHLVSEVKGVLRPDCDAIDAFSACFPAGTVSGAPKLRAMEIINELEPVKRGPYAGAVGYFSFQGNMDTCIAIRTMLFTGGKAYAQAGAGIVADSIPECEYEETVNKARILMDALKTAREGSV